MESIGGGVSTTATDAGYEQGEEVVEKGTSGVTSLAPVPVPASVLALVLALVPVEWERGGEAVGVMHPRQQNGLTSG
jgi:hypothetical protein